MKGLPGLIKIEQQRLETRRKALWDLERLAVQYRHQLDAIDRDMETESRIAEQVEGAVLALSRFLSAASARKKSIRGRIEKLEGQIDAARAQLAEVYREMRKYEIAHQREVEARAARLGRREQASLDDIGLTLHRMKGRGEPG